MDRVTVGITRYVIAKMGDKYVQPPTLDYSAIYRQSTQMTPIVFVLSPGADPAFDVFKLGRQLTNDQVLRAVYINTCDAHTHTHTHTHMGTCVWLHHSHFQGSSQR